MAKHLNAILAIIATLIATIPPVLFSKTFQTCVEHIPSYETYQHNPKASSYFFFSLGEKLSCIGPFIDINANAVIAVFTIVLTISTVAMWWETRKMAFGAEIQASISNKQTTILWEQVKPTLTINAIISDVGPNKIAQAVIKVKNSGQSAAYDFQMRGLIGARPFPYVGDWPELPDPICTSSMLQQGGERIAPTSLGGPCTADNIRQLQDGSWAIYVFAQISYTDALKERWVLTSKYYAGGVPLQTSFDGPMNFLEMKVDRQKSA